MCLGNLSKNESYHREKLHQKIKSALCGRGIFWLRNRGTYDSNPKNLQIIILSWNFVCVCACERVWTMYSADNSLMYDTVIGLQATTRPVRNED